MIAFTHQGKLLCSVCIFFLGYAAVLTILCLQAVHQGEAPLADYVAACASVFMHAAGAPELAAAFQQALLAVGQVSRGAPQVGRPSHATPVAGPTTALARR